VKNQSSTTFKNSFDRDSPPTYIRFRNPKESTRTKISPRFHVDGAKVRLFGVLRFESIKHYSPQDGEIIRVRQTGQGTDRHSSSLAHLKLALQCGERYPKPCPSSFFLFVTGPCECLFSRKIGTLTLACQQASKQGRVTGSKMERA
jgi:hypothetical protein